MHRETIDCHLLAAPQKSYNYRKLSTTFLQKCHETGSLAEEEKRKKKERKKEKKKKDDTERAKVDEQEKNRKRPWNNSPGTPDRGCTSVKKKKLPPLLGIRLLSFPQN